MVDRPQTILSYHDPPRPRVLPNIMLVQGLEAGPRDAATLSMAATMRTLTGTVGAGGYNRHQAMPPVADRRAEHVQRGWSAAAAAGSR